MSLWQVQPESYNGLLMRCAPGTHEAAMGLLRRNAIVPKSVLDLASGSGALVARMKDAGVTDVSAVELDAAKFAVAGITPLPLDLNTGFAAAIGRTFSLITAIEIVEHLDSPRHFLQQIRQLLSDDGVVLLSTPNVADWLGRIKFLLTGTLRYFDDNQYRYNHHVAPIIDLQMRHMMGEIGLRVIDSTTAGTFFGPFKKLVLSPLWIPFRLACGPTAMGDVNLYLAAKRDPQPTQPGDWTHDDTGS
jgi:SAM-dependent methyltransferase